MNIEALLIIWPAFIAGILVLLTHIPLGRNVLQRGIIFIDLAIAQIAGLGIIFASMQGLDTHGWELQLVAVISAIAGALLLSILERYSGEYQEAFIGITFVMAATGSILLLAHNPQGGEHLKDLLVGQILWVEWQQLVFPAIASLSVLAIWLLNRALFDSKAFYFIFAIAITVSVQLVGVYLVFASLILPALSVIKLPENKAYAYALFVGCLGYGGGLIISTLTDLPSGAVIVWVMCFIALVSGFINHRYTKD